MLTEHFSLEELVHSETAARLGIANTPAARALDHLLVLARALEDVRALLGGHPLRISSGFRSVALNAHVPGSSNTSAHTLGYAADFTCPEFGPPLRVCQAIFDSGLRFDQIILEYRAWCHLSVDPRARGELLTKNHGSGYVPGLHP